MDTDRYHKIACGVSSLSEDECVEGWHWCEEWDGLLVGPGMQELDSCTCLPPSHAARRCLGSLTQLFTEEKRNKRLLTAEVWFYALLGLVLLGAVICGVYKLFNQ